MKIQKTQQKSTKTSKIQKQEKTKKKTVAKQLSIQQLVKKNRNFEFTDNGKIRCKLTNHEMPATVQNYQSYIKSKSYKRGLESQFDIKDYQEILIDFKGDPRFLYCQLTGAKVAKKKSAVEKHIKGKKFQRVYQQFQRQQEEEEEEEEEEGDLQEGQEQLVDEESDQVEDAEIQEPEAKKNNQKESKNGNRNGKKAK